MATEYLYPNAAGDETNIATQYPSSDYHWDKVDDPQGSPDEDSTYVEQSGSTYYRDLYNLSAPTGSGTINYIKVWYRFRRPGTTGTAYLKPAIKTGGTAYEGTADTENADTYKNGSYQWTTNPYTGVAWTWDDLTSLQAGVSLMNSGGGARKSRCTQLYVEVDYTIAAAEKTSSDTGSGADAYVSLEEIEAKVSSEAGAGVEGIPLPSATLTGSESGSGIEALVARLLFALDTGTGTEVAQVVGLLRDLFVSEQGRGYDLLTAKIDIPIKGGGMKLWT